MRGRMGLAITVLVVAGRGAAQLGATPTPTPTPTSTPAATPRPDAAPRPSPMALRRAGQGDELARQGDWRAALFAYQEASHLDPRSAELHLKLGGAYEKLGYPEEAVRQYGLAAALDPSGTEAPARTARALGGRPPITRADTPAAAPYEQGVALIAEGRYAEAAARLDEAVRADPRLPLAYTARASALFGLSRYLEAAADYRAALALDPDQATPLFGLAECHRVLGQGPAALDHYGRYLASGAADVREDLKAEARRRSAELRPR